MNGDDKTVRLCAHGRPFLTVDLHWGAEQPGKPGTYRRLLLLSVVMVRKSKLGHAIALN